MHEIDSSVCVGVVAVPFVLLTTKLVCDVTDVEVSFVLELGNFDVS